MQAFTSLDLQKRTGDIQRAAAQEPVVITSHGKARTIVMSAGEFCRLKDKAGEAVPADARPARALTVRGVDDPLGYDTADFPAVVRAMLADVESGRTRDAVGRELGRVRARFATRPR